MSQIPENTDNGEHYVGTKAYFATISYAIRNKQDTQAQTLLRRYYRDPQSRHRQYKTVKKIFDKTKGFGGTILNISEDSTSKYYIPEGFVEEKQDSKNIHTGINKPVIDTEKVELVIPAQPVDHTPPLPEQHEPWCQCRCGQCKCECVIQ